MKHFNPRGTLTRREYLDEVDRLGGPEAVYHAMLAIGLLAHSTYRGPLKLQGSGAGKRVIVLGAGLAGMSAAYELDKLGYECTILEPRTRSGGRCWTVRRGTESVEIGGERQVCEFDDGLYYDPGPSRIPHHHRGVLNYCKEFGIELNTLVNFNRRAYFYSTGVDALSDTRIPQRAPQADMNGHSAEMLARAIRQDALDDQLSAGDQERLIDYLRVVGDLDEDMVYRGSPRRGYETPPGAGLQPGEVASPYELRALLRAEFWRFFGFAWGFDQQMTMLHPVGGMDAISRAFETRVGRMIRFESEVRAIRRTPQGVRILYHSLADGEDRQIEGDFCVCTIPLTMLAYIPGDYFPGLKQAIENVSYTTGARIGLQFSRRFWEEDDEFYGGISWTNQTIQQIIYPSEGFLTQKGVLVAAYPFGSKAFELSALPHAGRVERLLQEGEHLHPQYRQHFDNGFSVPWNRIDYTRGCFASYSTQARDTFYPLLNETDGYIYLAGEHMSYLTGWMEGAILSGLETVEKLHRRAQQA